MTGNPVLTGPDIPLGPNADSFSFFCNVQYTSSTPGDPALFKVTFLFDGQEDTAGPPATPADLLQVLPVTVSLPGLRAELMADFLRGRLGKEVFV